MAESVSAGDKTSEARVKKIEKPVRVQVRIEEETYLKVRHAMVDRKELGISKIVEEALRLWLETQGLDTAH